MLVETKFFHDKKLKKIAQSCDHLCCVRFPTLLKSTRMFKEMLQMPLEIVVCVIGD
jgi:hypothetical protein